MKDPYEILGVPRGSDREKVKSAYRELAKKSLELTPVLEIGRTDMITSLLTKSNMISFLPDFVTRAGVEAGELCYLDVKDLDISMLVDPVVQSYIYEYGLYLPCIGACLNPLNLKKVFLKVIASMPMERKFIPRVSFIPN